MQFMKNFDQPRLQLKELKLNPIINQRFVHKIKFSSISTARLPLLPTVLTAENKKKSAFFDRFMNELKGIHTNDIREIVKRSEKELTNKIATLKKITRIDTEESRQKRLKFWKNKGFIKVDKKISSNKHNINLLLL